VYITGESYAGKYIPSVAHYILTRNTEAGIAMINLEGVAIGNGELKPYLAYASTPDYLHNFGFIDDAQQAWAHDRLKVCKEQVDGKDWLTAFKTCQDIEDDLFANFVKLPFIYDVREPSDIFTELTAVTTAWINQPDVKAALNVGDRPWRQSDGQGPSSIGKPVPEHLKGDEMQDIPDAVIIDLIENYKFMFYSGQMDGSSCNFLGTQRMIAALEWDGKESYENSERVVWKVDDKVAGYFKGNVKGLSYVLVANSGHLVPTNQPENALDMLRRFINEEPFA
jgi:carboxypeptidase C (cathepsin A)